MSFSLSSLLNPSPDPATAAPPPRRDSLPPIQYLQSPEQHYTTSPLSAHTPRDQVVHPPGTEQDALQALPSLSSSNAQPSFQSPWHGQNASRRSSDGRSNSHEQRPSSSSGYNEPVHLPRPSSSGRHPSSPTLDQYHVASRSPEQRRPSIISSTPAAFTLPPIQALNPPQPEYSAKHLNAYEPPSQIHPPTAEANSIASYSQNKTSPQIDEYKAPADPHHPSTKPASPPSRIHPHPPTTAARIEGSSSPSAPIKQEATVTPRASSPIETQRETDQLQVPEGQSLKTIASLKNEHGLRTHSPLRESSVPMPSTEVAMPEPTNPKKRPAPSKSKKGTATTKKAPPSKKRKVEPKHSPTPSSHASKPFTFKTGSSVGTPAGSSPAPSTRSQTDDVYDEDEDMEDGDGSDSGDVYCLCRKPDNGTFMIGCDGTCDDWFHGKCVGIEERDKNLIDKYVCPSCTTAGVGKTTWKRICRRSGCRQAARVGKTKGGKDGSKYCSEECGVLYFREMIAKTRGREDNMKQRNTRRRGSLLSSSDQLSIDYDLGALGGTLAAGELKSLLNSSTTADDFKKLGEGVLSPPATPDSKASPSATKESGGGDFLIDSEAQALANIHRQKEVARRKHQLLKDRLKFVTMVKQAATRTATGKELKPKDYCGYDSRLEWADERFDKWRLGRVGKQAFELDTLAVEKSGDEDDVAVDTFNNDEDGALDEYEVCDRKKCARHLEWTKLAVDDVRFEMSDNGDRMRALEKEEKDLRQRAALRAKAGSLNGEGRVEVHGPVLGLEHLNQPQQQVGEAMVVDTVEVNSKADGEKAMGPAAVAVEIAA